MRGHCEGCGWIITEATYGTSPEDPRDFYCQGCDPAGTREANAQRAWLYEEARRLEASGDVPGALVALRALRALEAAHG